MVHREKREQIAKMLAEQKRKRATLETEGGETEQEEKQKTERPKVRPKKREKAEPKAEPKAELKAEFKSEQPPPWLDQIEEWVPFNDVEVLMQMAREHSERTLWPYK